AFHVTGVQTCALPICHMPPSTVFSSQGIASTNGTMTPKVEAIPWLEKTVLGGMWLVVAVFLTTLDQYLPAPVLAALLMVVALARSEERRVGRCGCGWW